MHTTLTTSDAELRAVLQALQGLQAGDGSVQLPEDWTGTAGEVARLFNQVARERASERACERAGERPEAPDRLRLRRRPRPHLNGSAPGGALNDDQTKELLAALLAVRRGDDTARLPLDWPGWQARWPTPSTTWSSSTPATGRSWRA